MHRFRRKWWGCHENHPVKYIVIYFNSDFHDPRFLIQWGIEARPVSYRSRQALRAGLRKSRPSGAEFALQVSIWMGPLGVIWMGTWIRVRMSFSDLRYENSRVAKLNNHGGSILTESAKPQILGFERPQNDHFGHFDGVETPRNPEIGCFRAVRPSRLPYPETVKGSLWPR